MIELNDGNFNEFINSPTLVAVDFHAPWCGPCRTLIPRLQSLSNKGFTIGSVNVDEQPSITSNFNISAIPAIIIFKNGQVVNKHTGLITEDGLAKLLQES